MALRSSFRLGLTALSFWPFLPIAARAPIYGRLLIELVADSRVPWSRKAILGIAVAYVVSPIDLIPDFIPFISRVDDVMVTIIALDLFLEGVGSLGGENPGPHLAVLLEPDKAPAPRVGLHVGQLDRLGGAAVLPGRHAAHVVEVLVLGGPASHHGLGVLVGEPH